MIGGKKCRNGSQFWKWE